MIEYILLGGEKMKTGKFLSLKKESVDFLDNYKKEYGVNHSSLVDLALDTFRLKEFEVDKMTDLEARTMLRSTKMRLEILEELKQLLLLRLGD